MTGPFSVDQVTAGIHKGKIISHLIRPCPRGGKAGSNRDSLQRKGALLHAETLLTRIHRIKIFRAEIPRAPILRKLNPGMAICGRTIRVTISLLAGMHRVTGFPMRPAVDTMSSAVAIQTGSIHPYQFAPIRELRRATSAVSSASIGGPGAGSKPWKVW